jgi:hypothetical protein
MSLDDNCLITDVPPSSISLCHVEIGIQRLPVILDAYSSFDTDVDTADGGESESSFSSSSSSSSSPLVNFTLHFDVDSDEDKKEMSIVIITDRHRLAKRWPFFRHLLDAGLSEAHSGNADLSPFFSLCLGRCLVDYFEGRAVHVSSLSTQDCRDLVAHADYFGLTTATTTLLAFCTAKLRKEKNSLRKEKRKRRISDN